MSKQRRVSSSRHAVPPAVALPAPAPYRRLYRNRDEKIVAGVAAGLAEHLRVPTILVRIVFIGLLVANGLGALLYVAFWAVLPVKPRPTETAPPARSRGAGALQKFGLAAIALGVIILQAQVQPFSIDSAYVALAAIVALGAGIIWHQTDPQRRRRDHGEPRREAAASVAVVAASPSVSATPPGGIGAPWGGSVAPPGGIAAPQDGLAAPVPGAQTALTPPAHTGVETPAVGDASVLGAAALGTPAVGAPSAGTPSIAAVADEEPVADRRWFFVRIIGGGLLVIIGIIGILGFFAPGEQNLQPILLGMLFALLALGGLVVALAPVLWRMVSQLREERVARIREQERAEVAAVVHDQVLHTLALIQRNAGDVSSVVRLARGQERTLRGWLYKPSGSPSERFAAALEQAAAEVEDTYGISVETVVVGDAEHDDRVAAMVAATREALVNSARHAKVGTVSLYAEAEDEQLSVFVRDRGAGFDLSHVDDDRHGVRGSIIGRMQRHGGVAQVRSSPGEGTEVELTMPRTRRAATGSGSAAGSTTKD
jgi:signal transduction histidine kinase/phage shock protein PspC (stress-responsive transcriptional regulator)